MRIGVDLDGVCYDFDGALKHFLTTYRGYPEEQLVPVTEWELYHQWGMSREEFLSECHRAVDSGIMFRWGAAYEGTRENLQRLVDAGHTLHVVTARGWGYPGVAEASTREWAIQELPPLKSLTFASDKTVARVDVMIEDNLDNYDALEEAGVAVYLLNRPWNQTDDRFRHRVDSMAEFADVVLAMDEEGVHV